MKRRKTDFHEKQNGLSDWMYVYVLLLSILIIVAASRDTPNVWLWRYQRDPPVIVILPSKIMGFRVNNNINLLSCVCQKKIHNMSIVRFLLNIFSPSTSAAGEHHRLTTNKHLTRLPSSAPPSIAVLSASAFHEICDGGVSASCPAKLPPVIMSETHTGGPKCHQNSHAVQQNRSFTRKSMPVASMNYNSI